MNDKIIKISDVKKEEKLKRKKQIETKLKDLQSETMALIKEWNTTTYGMFDEKIMLDHIVCTKDGMLYFKYYPYKDTGYSRIEKEEK